MVKIKETTEGNVKGLTVFDRLMDGKPPKLIAAYLSLYFT